MQDLEMQDLKLKDHFMENAGPEKEDQKKSGWKLKDHSRSYNKAKHSCIRRSNQSCQRERDAVLYCATQPTADKPLLLRNGPSKSSPEFSGPAFSEVLVLQIPQSCFFRSSIFSAFRLMSRPRERLRSALSSSLVARRTRLSTRH